MSKQKSNMELVQEIYPDAKTEIIYKTTFIKSGKIVLGKGSNGRCAWLSAARNLK